MKLEYSELTPLPPERAAEILKKHSKGERTIRLSGVEMTEENYVLEAAKHSAPGMYLEFMHFLKEASKWFASPGILHMHPRTWRLLKKAKRHAERFPHLYREHYPKRRTRSMRGK